MTFLHSFAPGGVERVALRLCGAWMRDAGLDLRLVMGRETGAMRGEAPKGLKRYVTSSGAVSTARFETFWMIWVLRREILRQQPDVLFCPGNAYSIVAVAMKFLLGRRCPPVVLKISNDLERPDMAPPVRRIYWQWLKIQGRRLQAFTGLAAPMRAEMALRLGVADSRIHIIEDPALGLADVAALEALGAARHAPASGRRFVAVGRLERQKNLPLLLEAFALAAGPDDRLTILGEGSERARLERAIAAAGLADRVSMPGHGPVQAALAAADVFVLSSAYEGVPAVVIEALAAGLPVVATDCSVSMRALVGRFGTVVPLGDAAALAAAMLAQPALDADARAEAAEAMRAFTVERAAGAYAGLFHAVHEAAATRLPASRL